MPRTILAVLRPAAGSGRTSRRRRARAATATATGLVALALASSAATPAHASVDRESYLSCVNAVADWTDSCRAASGSIVGDIACVAAGTVGILACAAAEALEQLGKGVSLQ